MSGGRQRARAAERSRYSVSKGDGFLGSDLYFRDQKPVTRDQMRVAVGDKEVERMEAASRRGDEKGSTKNFYAAGGYVTKAKTLNTPACAKGRRK